MIIQSKKQKRLERLFNYRRSLYEKKCYRYHRPRVSTAVKRFAFLPTRVGDHLVWNEWYYQHYILLSCSTIIGRRYLWVDSHRSRIEKRTWDIKKAMSRSELLEKCKKSSREKIK